MSGRASRGRRPVRGRGLLLARRVVQAGVLLAQALPLLVCGWGLFGMAVGGDDKLPAPAGLAYYGSLSSVAIGPVEIVDPFAALQVAFAAKTFDLAWLWAALPVLVVYGLVRGRAFCGWVCPVNLLLEGVDWLRRRLGLEVRERALPRHAKVWVALGVLVASALVGVPVFEVLSPVGAINKGILFGSVAGLATLAGVVVLELFWGRRVWCRSLCPLGGFYQVVGRVGLVNVRIDHAACVGCHACQSACLADPVILEPAIAGEADAVLAGDCMACGACVRACPVGALALRPDLGHYRRGPKAPAKTGEGAQREATNRGACA